MTFRNCRDCEQWKRVQPWGFIHHGKWTVLELCKSCIWQRRITDIQAADLRAKMAKKVFQKWKIQAGIPKMYTTSELVYFAKMKEQNKLDAVFKEIHSDGLEEWRKKHNQS